MLVSLLNLALFSLIVYNPGDKDVSGAKSKITQTKTGDFSELLKVPKEGGFKELSDFFVEIAEKKGAVYAFEVLRRAEMPPNTDLHLMGHEIGDILYKQEGIEGIKYCTQDFRNACSHSVVINIFYEEGEGAISKIRDACSRAPGGPGAYTMCFHGLGHGVLAYSGYDFAKTAKLCDKTQSPDSNEAVECMGGAVMEIIGGGGHDTKIWEKQRPKYLISEDPLSLCEQDFMIGKREICYTYITPFLFEAAGANLAAPTPENFQDAFATCRSLPSQTEEERTKRTICFSGFGKEFVVLASIRDIRDIGSMGEEGVKRIYEWCQLAGNSNGTSECLVSALHSLYWGGENKPDASFRLCNILDSRNKGVCYEILADSIANFANGKDVTSLCSRLPAQYRSLCNI